MSENNHANAVVSYAVVDTATDIGDMAYPFLPAAWQWRIHSRPMTCQDHIETLRHDDAHSLPTLRWVKDGQVMDLFVPGM
ncbi:MAG: hypothetical protein GY796_06670, partial [Chloroflexi bacterium]|nr:hypothetical protein [Chloroflexota bacterium]